MFIEIMEEVIVAVIHRDKKKKKIKEE